MGGTSDPATPTIDALLRRGLTRAGDGRLTLTLDPGFQGLPATAHGGSVLAAFDTAAAGHGPRRLSGAYRRRVPLGVPLALEVARAADGAACRLGDGAAEPLVEGGVALGAGPAPGPAALPADGSPLPVSRTCFACGIDNRLGLQVALAFDDGAVGTTWRPREPFRSGDGSLTPAALTTLLDEAAFWLGALASGESGMTTDLRVTLHAPAPFGSPIAVGGARAAVRARASDARYWDTEVVAADASGAVVASARITFVAIRGAARRLVTGMLAMNPPEVVRRVFPGYAP